jgi:CubicO group peptidase (beta-lactamase class C family)
MMLSQKLRLFLLMFLLISVVSMTITHAGANAGKLPELEQLIDTILQTQMEELHLPNAAVVVVSDGEVVFQKGYGYADLEERRLVVADDTLFRVGSVSKLFIWTALMHLVEQGKLDLNADVNQYLDFQIPKTLLHMRGNFELAPITLTHLMTHTAGFEAYPDEIFRLSYAQLLPLDQYVRDHLPARVFPPGEIAAYSNYGAALSGYIIQRVSGQPLEEYIEQHIFAPLGMGNSTFRQPPPAHLSTNLARPYRYVDGVYQPGDFEFMQAPEGGMSSTAADMAKFMIAHLQEENESVASILQAETRRQMHTRQLSQYTARHPALGGMALGFMEGTFNGQQILFHGGSTMLFDSGLYLLPDENIGIFITYSGASHLVHTTLFQGFMDRYYPVSEMATTASVEGVLERARSFAGEYHQNTRSFTTAEKFTSLQMGVVNVAVDDEGSLLITHVGETNRFEEVEPGVYRNLREGRTQDYFGPFRTVVLGTDPHGYPLLISDGPMTYSRVPWYASSSFTILALVVILLLMLGSLIVWGLGFLIGLFRKRRAAVSNASAVARWVASAFALLTLVFLACVLATGAPDPVYRLPAVAFGVLPAWHPLLVVLPWMLLLIGAAVMVFTIQAWVKGYWRLQGRIHYTIFATAGLLFLWILYYWNILL